VAIETLNLTTSRLKSDMQVVSITLAIPQFLTRGDFSKHFSR